MIPRFLAIAFLAGCSTAGAVQDLPAKSVHVRPGQTMQQVADALGPPGTRSFRGNLEAWQYCETGLAKHTFLTVMFADGRVAAMNTALDTMPMGACADAYPPIAWTAEDVAAAEAQKDRAALIAAGWLAGR